MTTSARDKAREMSLRIREAARSKWGKYGDVLALPDIEQMLERALLNAERNARREAFEEISRGRLATKLCEIVDGWPEIRHPKRLGFTAMKAGITCGDVYEFVDAIRAPAAEEEKPVSE